MSLALKTVAALFIADGVGSLVRIVSAAVLGEVVLDLGVFSLLIGPALLRRSSYARDCALTWTCVWLLLLSASSVTYFVAPDFRPMFQINGLPATAASTPHSLGAASSALLQLLVLLWLLLSREIREACTGKASPAVLQP